MVRHDDLEHVFICNVISNAQKEIDPSPVVVVLDRMLDKRSFRHSLMSNPHESLAKDDSHREVRQHLLQVILQLLPLQGPELRVCALPVPRHRRDLVVFDPASIGSLRVLSHQPHRHVLPLIRDVHLRIPSPKRASRPLVVVAVLCRQPHLVQPLDLPQVVADLLRGVAAQKEEEVALVLRDVSQALGNLSLRRQSCWPLQRFLGIQDRPQQQVDVDNQ
mmetsp:Transcript_702/g.1856  ORF Transcript_702/g.1856 Transcript_702/m.1856 type:complete len:219 (+) Transcript_702:336-992(+)